MTSGRARYRDMLGGMAAVQGHVTARRSRLGRPWQALTNWLTMRQFPSFISSLFLQGGRNIFTRKPCCWWRWHKTSYLSNNNNNNNNNSQQTSYTNGRRAEDVGESHGWREGDKKPSLSHNPGCGRLWKEEHTATLRTGVHSTRFDLPISRRTSRVHSASRIWTCLTSTILDIPRGRFLEFLFFIFGEKWVINGLYMLVIG